MDNHEISASTVVASAELITLTAEIASAYVAKNHIQSTELAAIIETIHTSLASLGAPKAAPEQPKREPLVSIRKSVTPDYLISLEDGKHYKSLKRHLTGRGLTPQQYREKWGLPQDYPMVASAYAVRRSELAKSIGLGRKKTEAPAPAPAPAMKRGRAKKEAA